MSDTPRTEAALIAQGAPGSTARFAEFTRSIERELIELAEALQEAIGIIDCLRDYVCEGGSIALIGAISSVREANDFMEGKARAALAKHRQPQEAPELFPGTLEKLRGLGK